VEENGARLNRGTTLAELHDLKNRLLSRTFRRKKPKVEVKTRTGGIKQAVVRSLELTDKPLALEEIHRACEDYLAQPVNYNTVKDCVHKHSRGKTPLFVRTSHGRYVFNVTPPEVPSYGQQVMRRRYPGK